MVAMFKHEPMDLDEEAFVLHGYRSTTFKPQYAPNIVKSFFRGHEWKLMSAEWISKETGIPLPQVRVICQRLVVDKFLCRKISNFRSRTMYYWFAELDPQNK